MMNLVKFAKHDPAFQLLLDALNNSDQRTLWLMDENIHLPSTDWIAPRSNLSVLTNRYDHYQYLRQRGFNVILNDFDSSLYAENSMDQIIYRISKEKAIVHHIINQSQRLLNMQGRLILSGFKTEGLKTYANQSAMLLGHIEKKYKGRLNAQGVIITKNQANGIPLDDQQYATLRSIDVSDGINWQSKPGIFGWNKLDKGSVLLWKQCIRRLRMTPDKPKTVLDIGCGYGYLGVMAGRLLAAHITAVDNNYTAVLACQENFRRQKIVGQVLCDDGGYSLTEKFDLILCNPPFHRGFGSESTLLDYFLLAAHRLLTKQGSAFFVVNAFIPVERKAKAWFSSVTVLANDHRFKVVELRLGDG